VIQLNIDIFVVEFERTIVAVFHLHAEPNVNGHT